MAWLLLPRRLYIADTGNNRVVEVPWDRSKDTYGAQATVGTNLPSPEAVAVGSGGKVYIANVGNSSVIEVPAAGSAAASRTSQTTVASQETNGLANPAGAAAGPSGNLYIVDNGNNRLILLPWNPSSGAYGTQTEVGAGLVGPRGVALDAMGNVYIADTGNNRVVKIAQSGGIIQPEATADRACDGRQTQSKKFALCGWSHDGIGQSVASVTYSSVTAFVLVTVRSRRNSHCQCGTANHQGPDHRLIRRRQVCDRWEKFCQKFCSDGQYRSSSSPILARPTL
jgi:sugar lactone lactonase YvrE